MANKWVAGVSGPNFVEGRENRMANKWVAGVPGQNVVEGRVDRIWQEGGRGAWHRLAKLCRRDRVTESIAAGTRRHNGDR